LLEIRFRETGAIPSATQGHSTSSGWLECARLHHHRHRLLHCH
jgi:hypothetical protein